MPAYGLMAEHRVKAHSAMHHRRFVRTPGRSPHTSVPLFSTDLIFSPVLFDALVTHLRPAAGWVACICWTSAPRALTASCRWAPRTAPRRQARPGHVGTWMHVDVAGFVPWAHVAPLLPWRLCSACSARANLLYVECCGH